MKLYLTLIAVTLLLGGCSSAPKAKRGIAQQGSSTEALINSSGSATRQLDFHNDFSNDCYSVTANGKSNYLVSFTRSGRGTGWMDKFELSISSPNSTTLLSGEQTKVTSGYMIVLFKELQRITYNAARLSLGCSILIQNTAGVISGTISNCKASSDPIGMDRSKEIVINGKFSCNDGAKYEDF